MLLDNDTELLESYLSGEEGSLEIIIGKYLQPIYSFVSRYIGSEEEAEDITQEIFLKVWRNIKKFDRSKNFKTWLFSIAKNSCIDFLRKKKVLPVSSFENDEGENMLLETLTDPSALPDELFEKNGLEKILSIAMEKLSPKYRMVLFLRYNDHFNFREISESLGESLDTIKSRHRRALIELKKLLTEQQ